MADLTHRFHPPFAVARQLLGGKTLLRALFNLAMREVTLGGRVLDLGSKSSSGSYNQYLAMRPGTAFTYTDLAPAEGVVALDVERPFPFEADGFDHVLAFHLFEHVFHHERAPAEVFRILKPGGTAVVSVPFMYEYHGDPDDYFRFTHSGLRRLWEEAGFECVRLEAVGEGLVTFAATRLPSLALPRAVRPAAVALCYLLATPLDRLIARRPRVGGLTVPQRYASDLVAVFRKPAPPAVLD